VKASRPDRDDRRGRERAAGVLDPDAAAAIEERPRQRRPHRYQVVLHNDDYTTMDFVVAMLMKHFAMPPAEALHVMLQVHHKGSGVAGIYARDVAETKVAEVTDDAREQGMPLLLTAEPLAPEADDAGGESSGRSPD
jgi:ATP-dependent Clp protease adaptor protein ClpS